MSLLSFSKFYCLLNLSMVAVPMDIKVISRALGIGVGKHYEGGGANCSSKIS